MSEKNIKMNEKIEIEDSNVEWVSGGGGGCREEIANGNECERNYYPLLLHHHHSLCCCCYFMTFSSRCWFLTVCFKNYIKANSVEIWMRNVDSLLLLSSALLSIHLSSLLLEGEMFYHYGGGGVSCYPRHFLILLNGKMFSSLISVNLTISFEGDDFSFWRKLNLNELFE